jgi:antirestriction protein ArdC
MAKHANAQKANITEEITAKIVEQLEQGTKPWVKEWATMQIGPPRRHNGEPYRGVNNLLLGMLAQTQGYSSPYWMTYNQAKSMGGQVRKGEKAAPVVYYGKHEKTREETDDQGNTQEVKEDRFFLKGYRVFNASQIDGLPDEYYPKPPAQGQHKGEMDIDPSVQKALDEMTTGLNLKGGYHEMGQSAFYSPTEDKIVLPPRDTFTSHGAYAATRVHEMAHATESPSRLDAGFKKKTFGDTEYAKGELYAELTAAFAGGHLGYTGDHIDNHAAYLQAWVKVLKADSRAIIKMASKAEKASDFLLEHTSEYNKEARNARYTAEFEDVAQYQKPVESKPTFRKGGGRRSNARAAYQAAQARPKRQQRVQEAVER